MSDYNFIKEFTNIKINKICEKLGVSATNVSSGKMSPEHYKKIKNEIIKELLLLILEDKKDDLIPLYLYNELLEKVENENKLLREMI